MTKDIINVIQIDEELDAEYEAAKVLRKYPKETVMLNNIKVMIFQLSLESVIQERK